MENFNVLYSEHSIKSKVIFLTLNLLQIDILKNWKDCLGLEHCTTYIHTTMDHQYECSCLSVVCLLEHYESIEKMKHSLKQQCFHVSKWKQTFSNENLKNFSFEISFRAYWDTIHHATHAWVDLSKWREKQTMCKTRNLQASLRAQNQFFSVIILSKLIILIKQLSAHERAFFSLCGNFVDFSWNQFLWLKHKIK